MNATSVLRKTKEPNTWSDAGYFAACNTQSIHGDSDSFRARGQAFFREARTSRECNYEIHGCKWRARVDCGYHRERRVRVVEGLRHGRSGEFRPGNDFHLYRLASLSKPLTATAAMQLWERGKLNLDTPLQHYCPEFPQKECPITTRELLGHLGGIRHYTSDSQDDPETRNTKHFDNPIEAGLKFFANDPLVAKPGTKFSYSTQGFTLVGCAIDGASSEKYVDYLRKNIFLPAGMTRTQSDDRFAVISYRARFYHKDQSGRVVNAELLDSSYKIPGGGWLSSADDMARFEVAILRDRLIQRATRDVMWTPQKLADGSQNEYALGWGTGKETGVPEVGHLGGQQSTSTFIMLAPERGTGVVVLVNMDHVDVSALGTELLKIILGTRTK